MTFPLPSSRGGSGTMFASASPGGKSSSITLVLEGSLWWRGFWNSGMSVVASGDLDSSRRGCVD